MSAPRTCGSRLPCAAERRREILDTAVLPASAGLAVAAPTAKGRRRYARSHHGLSSGLKRKTTQDRPWWPEGDNRLSGNGAALFGREAWTCSAAPRPKGEATSLRLMSNRFV